MDKLFSKLCIEDKHKCFPQDNLYQGEGFSWVGSNLERR